MKVSLHIIKQYIDFELPSVDELVARINAQLGGVEEVIDLNAKYKDAKIVRVVECEKHPDADKLSVCRIDAGTGELIQVVCGAPNVHAGMWAIWLPSESIVPNTFGTADELKLGAREIRGVISNGMLASARELAIGDDHDGIVELTETDLPKGKQLSIGSSFAETFGLNDYVIDIENKMFTHRPDLFGQLGVAREIAGIFQQPFTSPEWYTNSSVVTPDIAPDTLELAVFNDAPEKAPRFMAVVIKDIEVKQSPLWLKCALVAMGGKPINTIVDATNYIMLLTAQPTHAYDYDKIRGNRLGVRMAQGGEKLPLLNGKTYELTNDDIVIADGEGAIGLAGIMGGANSEVSTETKNIVLEVANFDMYAVRKSSMRHGIFTDALTRFNKGQSPLQNPVVMVKLMEIIGGKQASEVFDLKSSAIVSDEPVVETIHFINERLGFSLSLDEMQNLLRNVELRTSEEDGSSHPNPAEKDYPVLIVVPPFWRTDIVDPEDIVEEVGRLYGYDHLPLELPLRTAKPTPVNAQRELAQRVREALARSGANEVLTYSFVHERVLRAAVQDKNEAYQLSNALSPDLQYYRLSLTPSLLDKVHGNSRAGYDEFALFEIGKAHSKSAGLDQEGLPIESEQLSFVYASKHTKDGAPFYRIKPFLAFLSNQLGIELAYEPLGSESTSPIVMPFQAKRSAIITDKSSGAYVGVMGEYKKIISQNFKLPEYAAGFELDLSALLKASKETSVQYQPLSRYPSVERDISLKVSSDLAYAEVFDAVQEALSNAELSTTLIPLGIYQPKDRDTKNMTFRITLTSHDTTLTNDQVNVVMDSVVQQLKEAIGSELV